MAKVKNIYLINKLQSGDLWECAFCKHPSCAGGHNFEPFNYDYVCFDCGIGYWSCSDEFDNVKINSKEKK